MRMKISYRSARRERLAPVPVSADQVLSVEYRLAQKSPGCSACLTAFAD
jgi:hypothetical protein